MQSNSRPVNKDTLAICELCQPFACKYFQQPLEILD